MKIREIKKLQTNAQKVSSLLKRLAHPERLLILCQLVQCEQSAGSLWKSSSLSQSAFSQHLAVLRNEGLVSTRKEMQTVYYSLADDDVQRLLASLHEIFCQT